MPKFLYLKIQWQQKPNLTNMKQLTLKYKFNKLFENIYLQQYPGVLDSVKPLNKLIIALENIKSVTNISIFTWNWNVNSKYWNETDKNDRQVIFDSDNSCSFHNSLEMGRRKKTIKTSGKPF